MKSISGEAAKSLIKTQIELFERDLATKLAVFEPTASVKIWLNTLRSIEELINLPFSIDSDFLRSSPIFSVELQRFVVESKLIKHFENAIS